MALLAEQVDLVPQPRQRETEALVVDVAAGPAQQVAVSYQESHLFFRVQMPARQKYRLRARSDREVIREVEPGMRYVDRDSGEELRVVGAVLPLAPSPSDLPYSVENLRMCGCSLEQLVQKDLNDCPHCGRRLPAVER